MTHLRAPLTFPAAMDRIAQRIGHDTAARIAGRSVRTIYAWSHPATLTLPPIDQALAFDAAWRAAGGEGAPFHEALTFQLGQIIDPRAPDARALAEEIGLSAREHGEALAAVLPLTHSNACPTAVLHACGQIAEAVDALEALQQRAATFLPSGAGPGAGMTGVPT